MNDFARNPASTNEGGDMLEGNMEYGVPMTLHVTAESEAEAIAVANAFEKQQREGMSGRTSESWLATGVHPAVLESLREFQGDPQEFIDSGRLPGIVILSTEPDVEYTPEAVHEAETA